MATPTTIPDIVHSWFSARLACGAIARDTEAYNQASAALPDLIASLEAAQGASSVSIEAADVTPAAASSDAAAQDSAAADPNPLPDTASAKKG